MPLPPHPLASLEQIIESPSRRDGVSEELEMDLRAVGCQLIQELGVLVELPQSTLATAQVLLHRFYYVSSMLSFSINDVALASLYLSSKLCETPIRLRDLLNVYLLLLSRLQHLQQHISTPIPLKALLEGEKPFPDFAFTAPPFHSTIFYELKDALIVTEIQILKRLGFNLQCDLAYSHLVNYCKILDLVNKEGVIQLCWGILNDASVVDMRKGGLGHSRESPTRVTTKRTPYLYSLQTPLYTHHPPPTLACFSILLATRLLRLPLPDRWWILFDAEYEDMWACCGTVMELWEVWGTGPVQIRSRGGVGDAVQKGEENMQLDEESVEAGTKNAPIELDSEAKRITLESTGTEEQERRWRRAWKLMLGKKYVRRWVDADGKDTIK